MCSSNTSLGSLSPKSWFVHAVVVLVHVVEALEEVRDPADAALGERELAGRELACSMGDQTRSAAHCTMFIGCSVIITSIGASIDVDHRCCDDEPMWRQTTVPVSAQACKNGSQWSEW